MKTKTLLVVHDIYKDDNLFPLGIGYLSSALKKGNVDVDIYCMDIYHQSNKELVYYLENNKYDSIGLGFMAARFNETILPLCNIINRYKGDGKFILGGHCPSAIPEYILKTTKADCIITGESENIACDVFSNPETGKIYHGIPTKNLDTLPFPEWDLFPMDRYITSMRLPGTSPKDKISNIITSRGCPNKCTFCYRMENGLRLRSMDNVVLEIKQLYDRYGVNYIVFDDEFFALNNRRLEEFRYLLDYYNLNIKFWCASRVSGVNDDTLELMKLCGCKFINYGFESTDANVLKQMRKNTTPEDNENAARLTKENDILFGLNFIWGMPGDTEQSLYDNVKFIKKYNMYPELRTIRPVTPYPGCELYYKAIKDGLLDGPEDFFNKFKNSDYVNVNFTDMKVDNMCKYLYKANKELIEDHYNNTNMSKEECNGFIDGFYNLYFKKQFKFRGARKYDKK